MFAIIGSGFGRYGYKSALDRLGCPSRNVGRKDEIRESAVIIAVPPQEQPPIVRRLIRDPKIRVLLLEKPLAHSPKESMKLLKDLKAWGGKFRIGYLFSDTDWAESYPRAISWKFMAAHYANNLDNWKRKLGVLRYYGIHVVAYLSQAGYTDIVHSLHDDHRWHALFIGHPLTPCVVDVNSKSEVTSFKIDGKEILSPWGKDDRVDVLARSLKKFMYSKQPEYGPEIELWAKVEAA